MVASIFVIQGYETFRRPERVAPRAESVVRPLAERIPAVPAKTEDAVRLNGAVQMVAGLLLALGRFPRLSALALAATLVPTTAAGHRFWEAEEEADQAQQRIGFLKNLAHPARRQDGPPGVVPGRPYGEGVGQGRPEGRAPVRAPSGQLIRRRSGLPSAPDDQAGRPGQFRWGWRGCWCGPPGGGQERGQLPPGMRGLLSTVSRGAP
jgi:uncharacterized membrane protein YphA (DoxX/SURF4 family)